MARQAMAILAVQCSCPAISAPPPTAANPYLSTHSAPTSASSAQLTLKVSTSAPTSVTMPTISCPGTMGKVELPHSPLIWCKSEWQIPEWVICTRTSSGPTAGEGRGQGRGQMMMAGGGNECAAQMGRHRGGRTDAWQGRRDRQAGRQAGSSTWAAVKAEGGQHARGVAGSKGQAVAAALALQRSRRAQ